MTSNASAARISGRFYARDLHLVMGPATRGSTIRFSILIDGRPPAADHGVDVDVCDNGKILEPGLYQLVRLTGAIGDALFEIEFLDASVEANAFTFG